MAAIRPRSLLRRGRPRLRLLLALPRADRRVLSAALAAAESRPDDPGLVLALPRAGWRRRRHGRWLGGAGRLAAARHTQARHWLRDAVRIRFGSDGLERAGAALDLASGEGPFSRLARIGSQIVASRVRK
jgi:hypothetical protein